MAKVYSWKMDGIFHADATICKNEIDSLMNITPQEVLNYAKDNPQSELHKCFDWDDESCANKYRLQQARKVITFIVEPKKQKEDVPIRSFQISSERNEYKPLKFFVERPDEHQTLLKRAGFELKNIRNRYSQLSELENVIEAIDEFLETVTE